MLYIFGGLPGTGKSTLAASVARGRKAFYLRIDTIEQALRNPAGAGIGWVGIEDIGPLGYLVAMGVALDNLRAGAEVVADSVNPLAITRDGWRDVALRAGSPFKEIEVICSNEMEHRLRVETRITDVPGLKLPTWDEVRNREYEPWHRERIVIDTAGQTPIQSIAATYSALHIRP